MRTMLLAGLSSAALFASAAPAMAAANSSAGHWAWQAGTQFGPRASMPAARRVWLADPAMAAKSACNAMSASMPTVNCMAMMQIAQPNG